MSEHPQLEMERTSLAGLPGVGVPVGCRVRTYGPGDEEAWCRLVNEGIGGEWTDAALEAEMARAEEFEPADLIFAVAGGDTIGTSWALRRESFPPGVGAVHMVAVEPEHRGRGLGRPLVLSALRRLCARGLSRATLRTDDLRLPAIKVYLSVGFRPLLTDESHPARWRDVYERLKLREDDR